jgi:hypothetical protein
MGSSMTIRGMKRPAFGGLLARFGFGGGAWLEVEGGFHEREVRVLAGIVKEAARC